MKKTLITLIIALGVPAFSLTAAETQATEAKPQPVKTVQPLYPTDCALQGVEGDVIVEGLVTDDGRIVGVEAVRATDPALAAAAVEAIGQWEFQSADEARGGSVVRIPVHFRLEGTQPVTSVEAVAAR